MPLLVRKCTGLFTNLNHCNWFCGSNGMVNANDKWHRKQLATQIPTQHFYLIIRLSAIIAVMAYQLNQKYDLVNSHSGFLGILMSNWAFQIETIKYVETEWQTLILMLNWIVQSKCRQCILYAIEWTKISENQFFLGGGTLDIH